MNPPRKVAQAPSRPVMLFDGDCGFCRLWIRRWKQTTGEAVDYISFQQAIADELYPELAREQLGAAVHFVDADGAVYQGAEAVFRSLATHPSRGAALRWYLGFPWWARATESAYRFVAGHRSLFSRLTGWLWGGHVERARHVWVRRLFLSSLGLVYFIAFVSLWTQIVGLVGEHGILPASQWMSQVRAAADADEIGIDRYRLAPTLAWFGVSDTSLRIQCAAGSAIALLLIVGVAPRYCLICLWLLYLSLTTIGQEFLGFQWDNLLLETGLLSIFLAPGRWLPGLSTGQPPSRIVLWLLRLLLFKLMFLSGAVKLMSGDEAWRNLTALTYHYQTQPLPNVLAWEAQQLPLWFQKMSCGAVLAIELAVPFLIFAPRRLRMAGGIALATLQVLIALTGNYTFFNLLTLALCLLLLDDAALTRGLPRKWVSIHTPCPTREAGQPHNQQRRRRALAVSLAAMVVSVSAVQILRTFGPLPAWTFPAVVIYSGLSPLRSLNSYGLFAIMTKERMEIVVEGSDDQKHWEAYGFRYQPGDPNRRPPFVAPHQPRLDWQMWFAALGNARQNPWFVSFCHRLLEGSPDVLALLGQNPFRGKPPRYIRARLYEYQFTTRMERKRTGAWWKRELKGEYLPAVSLEMFH